MIKQTVLPLIFLAFFLCGYFVRFINEPELKQSAPMLMVYEMNEHYQFIPYIMRNLVYNNKLDVWDYEIIMKKDNTYRFAISY